MKSQGTITPWRADNSAEIVSRIRKGDAAAWRDLVGQYEPLLRWVARQYRQSAEDVDDAVQVTWLRCLEHIDQLIDADRLGAWLTTICRRESIRLATKGQREVPLNESQVTRLMENEAAENDPSAEAARRDEHDRLYRAIAALPQRQRVVLVEFLTREGQSYLDLSHRVGLPVGSVGPTRQRALTRLRNDPRLAELSSSETSGSRMWIRSA
jgi:RNA polymerase sigma factor (sigma-70 family)